ncbi:peptidoglycan editing factor PgeF [Arundinibacter roseus]|uniref:Purine nucleoside phosphorylase n=1 Tax=Arundinibacter roseus TaxID=2070510 RepID=A0A4R4K4U9_9BACT|nr:peptidoglycan editing factor PgeF [Arundinibacter roseus]TDB62293.1 peptidoglycan editing factor PgeF [Arundinibacter roseus]
MNLYRTPTIFATFPHLLSAESTRHGGVSPFPYHSLNLGTNTNDSPEYCTENRRRFWQALGISENQVASSYQVHGDSIKTVTNPGQDKGYDALITNKKEVILAVTVADCTPILIYDSGQAAVAAIHAGWRGTAKQIVAKTIQQMKAEFGTRPVDCYAYIGTCIDACAFEVGPEVAEQFDSPFKSYSPEAGKYLIDLKKANAAQLTEQGIPISQIEISPYSTVQNNGDYFSYRLENGTTGRMLACIGLRQS